MHLDWIGLVILVCNAVVSVLTNLTVNQKRSQVRSTD